MEIGPTCSGFAPKLFNLFQNSFEKYLVKKNEVQKYSKINLFNVKLINFDHFCKKNFKY